MPDFTIKDFIHWRTVARQLIANDVKPDDVMFRDVDDQQTLFGSESADQLLPAKANSFQSFKVPREFLNDAENVGYHRSSSRWNLLYRVLWRIVNEQKYLLEITTDDDVLRLNKMEKEVRRDAHKMKAFVRFRKILCDADEHFVAWHRPDHRIVRKVAPFFSRRFKAMNWTILTPHESVVWDRKSLKYGEGVPRSEAPDGDELEGLWLTYYANIFNPARIKIKMMKSEMPVRHWPTLPETQIIPDLLSGASGRVEKMIRDHEGFATTAANLIEDTTRPPANLNELKQLAANCTACDLYQDATQTVFGEGPADAKIVVVGEQPGDQEDLAGRPFVGPAGNLLEKAFAAAGIAREIVYVTNTVKHFKHKPTNSPTGKKRLHQRPNAREIRSCRPWFEAEWSFLTDAEVLVCLGATAASTLIGPNFRLTSQRGTFVETEYCQQTTATWHPAAILRAPDTQLRRQKFNELVDDLTRATNYF